MAQTLDQIVRQFIIEVGENTPHRYAQYLQYGIATLKDLWLDVSGTPVFSTLTVNDNGTVDLPDDFISELGVYICTSDGNMHPLGRNRKMCVADVDDCGNTVANTGSGNSGGFASNDNDHYKNGEFLGRYFGVGGGNNSNGYYDIKETEGYILLQNFTGDNILLEYLADLSRNSNGEYEIHPYLPEVIKAGIFWRSVRRNGQKTASEREMAFADFKMEKEKAHRRFQSFTLDEAKATIRKTFTPTAKH